MSRHLGMAAALAVLVAVAGCSNPERQPESPSPTETGEVSINAWPNDVHFDFSGMGGLTTHTSFGDLAAESGWQNDPNACSSTADGLFRPLDGGEQWGLYVEDTTTAGVAGITPDARVIDTWVLATFGDLGSALPPAAFGPTGPEGVRLGMTTSEVRAVLDIARVIDVRSDVDGVTYREYIVLGPNDTVMVVATVDDAVTMIGWGGDQFGQGIRGRPCAE